MHIFRVEVCPRRGLHSRPLEPSESRRPSETEADLIGDYCREVGKSPKFQIQGSPIRERTSRPFSLEGSSCKFGLEVPRIVPALPRRTPGRM
jgi:hypothetical protein